MEARYVKLHCRYDERNADRSVNDVSTFRNTARAIVTVGYYETNRREVYGYDAQGNRESVETRLGGRTETAGYEYYPNSDRVKTSGTRAYVYDANGNMTERGTASTFTGDAPDYEEDDYYRQYEYDLQNRLVKVSGYLNGALVTLASYQYASDNLRLSKTANGNTTRYVHGADGYELCRSTSAGDSVSTVWLFGRKLAELETASGVESRTYLHTDHLGTVIATTDEAGNTVWLGDATAFGVATADIGLESRVASYTGKDFDAEAGLYYFNARWYDAELGRFTTEDPARDDLNWYVYCGNSPLLFKDIDGLQPTHDTYTTGSMWTQTNIPTPAQALESKAAVKEITEGVIRAAISFTPIGDLNDAIAAFTGYDILYNEKLSAGGRLLAAAAVGIGTGKGLRVAGEVAGEALQIAAKKGDDVVDAAKAASKVGTSANQAYFWSGLGDAGADTALGIANSKGGVTLEKLIAERGISMPSFADNPQAWADLSREYAQSASGKVRAVLGPEVRAGSIWQTVELPALLRNPNVTRIITVNPTTGAETTILSRLGR